jgi:hypothetical protein
MDQKQAKKWSFTCVVYNVKHAVFSGFQWLLIETWWLFEWFLGFISYVGPKYGFIVNMVC